MEYIESQNIIVGLKALLLKMAYKGYCEIKMQLLH